jgi:hypothetical protein
MVKKIPLTKGKFTIVDDCDFDILNKHSWYYSSHGYAARSAVINGKKQIIYMHRQIMETQKGFYTDHKNLNRLDNTRGNLRVCTSMQSSGNIGKRVYKNKKLSSRFKGVHWSKCAKKWVSQFCINGKRVSLGLYENEIDAAKAYNKAAIEKHGEFALVNIIP